MNDSVTIDQAIAMRNHLNAQILAAIQAFETDTQIRVIDIQLIHMSSVDDLQRTVLASAITQLP